MRETRSFKIGIVAGEVSGDLLAAGLIRELKKTPYNFEFTGIAGPEMQKLGCKSLYPMMKLTVMGLDHLFGRIFEILKIRRSLLQYYKSELPDLFIGIDAPDFNLGLEKNIRKAGIPVLHYVSPTVWAWRKYRLRSMQHSIDRILVLFPFELDFYRQHRLNVKLVGHPMVKDIPFDPDVESLRKRYGLSLQKKVIALLPGSRRGEIQRMAGDFLQAAADLSKKHPNLQFVTAMPDSGLMKVFEAVAEESNKDDIDLVRVVGHSRDIMACSDILMLASGTAALEAAIVADRLLLLTKYPGLPRPWFNC